MFLHRLLLHRKNDGEVGISARSLGEINVQLIMEKLGGGGHLTNAACQIRRWKRLKKQLNN